MSETRNDAVRVVREALALGSDQHPAGDREPVYVWTDAEAALDRIEAVVNAAREAMAAPTGVTFRVCREALASLTQETPAQEERT